MISLAFISLLCVTPQNVDAVTLLDGKVLKFDLIAVSNNQLKLTTDDLTQSINTEQVEQIGFAKAIVSDVAPKMQMRFSNGASLSCRSFRLEPSLVKLSVGPAQKQNDKITVDVSRSLLKSIKLDKSISDSDWKKMLAIEIESDGLIIDRDGELDVLEGIVKSINNESVQFDFQGRVNDVKLSRLAGIRFFQPNRNFKTQVSVQDIFGNTIFGSQVELDDSKLKVIVDKNELVTIPKEIVANIDFSVGRYVKLSQLRPSAVEWKPFLRSSIEDELVEELLQMTLSTRKCWTANASFGNPLSLKSKEVISRSNPTGRIDFSSGISVLGGSSLVFPVPDEATQFTATSGIQLGANPAGAVVLQMKVDGKVMFAKAISASDRTPTPIAIDLPVAVDGIARRITIEVGYGAGRQVGDVLSICNARFSK